jgi:hypothetical protein
MRFAPLWRPSARTNLRCFGASRACRYRKERMMKAECCSSCGALPCDQTQRPEPTAREFIEHLVKVSEAVGWQAGVGGLETAGGIVSYLAEHPGDLEPFMIGGYFELPSGHHEHGKLSWHGMNGKIVFPEFARRARIVNKLKERP